MTLAQLINVLYSVVDRMYLGRLPGHLALTGLGLTMPIVSILMGFANLCGMGGAPLCSICRGQGDDEEAEHILGNSFTLLLILGAAATLVFLLLKRPVLCLFGASEATFPYADAYLTVYLCGTLFVMVSLGMNLKLHFHTGLIIGSTTETIVSFQIFPWVNNLLHTISFLL